MLKFMHILYHDDLKFNGSIVRFMNDSSIQLDESEHFFVTPYVNVYNALKKYPNVMYYETKVFRDAEIVNQYAPKCDYLVLHNICEDFEFIRIKTTFLKKILWRSWGGNRLGVMPYTAGRLWPLKIVPKFFLNHYIRARVKCFAGIGIANNVDRIELQQKFGKKIPMFRMPYPEAEYTPVSVEAYQKLALDRENINCLNVMIGHSGFSDDNHIAVMNSLKHFKDKKIHLYLPLSYGNDEYIEKIKKYVFDNWNENTTIISEFLDYQDYVRLLAKMDVAIFDATYSYALGNIAILLLLKKKIFLNKGGVIKKAFQYEGIPFETTDAIANMSFDDFSKPIEYKDDSWKTLSLSTYDQCVNYWNEIIRYCKRRSGENNE